MTTNNHKPRNQFDPRNWEPRTEDGKLAKQQYLDMLAKQQASKVRAKDDEEKLRIAQAIIEEVQAKRAKDHNNDDSFPSEADFVAHRNNDLFGGQQ